MIKILMPNPKLLYGIRYINEVRSIKREHVKIVRKDGKTTVTITYETKHPYIGDLFIGGNFSESVVIDR